MDFLVKLIPCMILILSSCYHSTATKDDMYSKVNNEIVSYYNNCDIQHLHQAKEYLESLNDDELFDLGLAEQNVRVFVLLQRFDDAISFIERTDDAKFVKRYQKPYYMHSLLAMKAETKNDTISAAEHYSIIIELLHNYIDSEYDETAFYELYLTKTKILPTATIENELDSIANGNGPYNKCALNLKNSILRIAESVNIATTQAIKY